MNKTISINLGGFFFHIDEDAYQKLSCYFDAVKRSLSPDGRDEIMKDIESRIAELFQERLKNEKQVVGLLEIEEVISIMGQPEDYKIDDDKTSYQSNSTSSTNYYYPSKRLYRDKDNGMIGGVMAGLGHYLGVDALWLRILMVILFFGFGTGLFVYIVLWILVPEAITTTQKLEMKGQPITISNIEKKVKEGFDDITSKFSNIDHEKIANTAKSGATKIGSTIEEVIMTIFKVIAKIIGSFIVFFSAIALIAIVVTSIILMFSSTMPENYILNHINTPIGLETPLWAQGILFLLGFGIPLFFLFILGLKLMVNNLRSIGNYAKYSLLAIWIIAVGIIISLGINEASQLAFEGKSVQKEVIAIALTDTLKIKFKNNDFYSKNKYRNHDFKITQDEGDNEIIYSNNVSIEIKKTDAAAPYLLIEKLAKGKSTIQAKKRAEKIKYNFKIEGNTLILDNYLLTALENKFRGQEVEIYLYLPKGTVFQTEESYGNYDRSDYDFFDENEFDTKNPVYRVESDKVRCLNCSDEEIDDNMSLKINVGDTSASIYYDENGVLVKKVINTEENGVVTTKEEYIIEASKEEKEIYKEIKSKKNK
ncbi:MULTISPECIES: PspC domain-containing protein [unclassified Flavobacterium]|uniref:PspC domain-containing protein n=1 Tax=unclassified Flavobacterium TaxID=196869 RepID=UPI0012911A10|nr:MULTISPECIES: PspC domain-containing protein [unclassified Flavobacterium]MQP52594.1 PspC domain-containing protein [Flavobacterium sp. LMO9]MQP62664.1 PspC domain-containing protein [Flavobacterium sp. LMO6]